MPSLEEAIDHKYGRDEEEDFSECAVHIYVPKINPRYVINLRWEINSWLLQIIAETYYRLY